MIRVACVFWIAAALIGRAAVISDDFARDPLANGWRIFGDSSLFRWSGTSQNLEVTWDSAHSNSFIFIPLRTIVSKSDDFSFSFDLRLRDIQVGATPGKTNTFEIAVGFLNSRT